MQNFATINSLAKILDFPIFTRKRQNFKARWHTEKIISQV